MELDDKNSPPVDPTPTSDSAGVTRSDGPLEWPPQVETSSPLPWPLQPRDQIQPAPASPTPDLFASFAPPPVPEDLQVPWGWLDIALLVAIGFLGTFAVSVLLVFGAGALGVSLARLRSSPIDQSIFLIVNQAVISLVLLVSQVLNTIGVGFAQSAAGFVVGLYLMLLISALNFVFLLYVLGYPRIAPRK